MATKYGKHPNVIYEIWNEPDYFEWDEVKAYSEEVIEVIRTIDPDNIILVGSPHWDQDLHLVAADPIQNVSNIMYTMHFYAAFMRHGCVKELTQPLLTESPFLCLNAVAQKPMATDAWV